MKNKTAILVATLAAGLLIVVLVALWAAREEPPPAPAPVVEEPGTIGDQISQQRDPNPPKIEPPSGEFFMNAGDDSTYFGSTRDDLMRGGADNDRINGGDGDDTIFGEGGDDQLKGGRGNDRLFGGEGNDHLIGSFGDDELDGGEGDDRVMGGEGRDNLVGGAGNDWINGGDGDDVLDGTEGDNRLEGQEGDDILRGGPGANVLEGGDGKDTYVYSPGSDSGAMDEIHGLDEEDGDVLDLSGLLTGGSYRGDGSAESLSGYMRITDEGVIEVDRNGQGNFVPLVKINGKPKLDKLIKNGQLKVR